MMVDLLVKQFFNTVKHVIWEVIRAGLVGLVIGLAIVEIAGAFIEGHWPFHPFVHLLAIAFGLVLGYALAMTVAFFEGVKSIFNAVGQVENTITAAVEGTAHRVGDVVDAVEHHPQHRPQQASPVAPPAYNPNPAPNQQPAPQYVESPPYGQNPQYGQFGQNPQYGQYGQFEQPPQYPPRQ